MQWNFLETFARLFDAKFKLSDKVSPHLYFGYFIWKDDKQKIKWEKNIDNDDLEILIELIRYIIVNRLIRMDKILLSPEELAERLKKNGWERNRALKAIENLMKIEIKMIDDQEETDSFFIHF